MLFLEHAHLKFLAIHSNRVEDRVSTLVVDGKALQLRLCDTAGQEDYDRLRPLSYDESSIVIITFSINSRTSFNNIRQKVSVLPLTIQLRIHC